MIRIKYVIKGLMPHPLWRKMRLLREKLRNRKSAKYFLDEIRKRQGQAILTPMDELVINELRAETFNTILEVGSGGGRLTYWFTDQGYEVVGIEPDRWYRDFVNGFMNELRVSNCKIINGDIHRMPYSDNTFDVVVCNAVIEHVQDPQKAISELIRCARKLCIVSVPYGFEADSPDHKYHFFENDINELFSGKELRQKVVLDRPGGNKTFLITVLKK